MLLQLAVADALGIAFEFVKDPQAHGLRNDLTYQQNPRFADMRPSEYTDDTLRSIATALVVTGAEFDFSSPYAYIEAIQSVIRKDRRKGWSRRFQTYVEANLDVPPMIFARGWQPASSNGALMGCLPVAWLPHVAEVKLAAAAQALATHTAATIPYAQALAVAAHYFLQGGDDREVLIALVREQVDHDGAFDDLSVGPYGRAAMPVDMSARATCFAVLDILSRKEGTETLGAVIRAAIAMGGDTDSVAALATGIASCAPGAYPDDLDPKLYDELDHGHGRALLEPLDARRRWLLR